MRFLAWTNIVLIGIPIIIGPLILGKERKPYDYNDYLSRWLTLGLLLPICGRILGWW